MLNKTCAHCNKVFAFAETRGQRKYCSDTCYQETRKTYWKRVSRKRVLAVYGISEIDFQKYFEQQDGKCAICQDMSDKLYVDHNHTTNEVRGLLCMKCNCALGLFNDSLTNLENATKYIKQLKTARGVK